MKTIDDYVNEIKLAVVRYVENSKFYDWDRDCERIASQLLKSELKNIIYEIETEARLDTRRELMSEFELRRFFEE